MKQLILRVFINGIAIWITAYLLSGFSFSGSLLNLLVVSVVFGLVNAFIRPIIKLLTLPLNVMTLGLFTLVINALMVMLTAWLTGNLAIEGGFLSSFFTAVIAALIISVISTILSWFLIED